MNLISRKTPFVFLVNQQLQRIDTAAHYLVSEVFSALQISVILVAIDLHSGSFYDQFKIVVG